MRSRLTLSCPVCGLFRQGLDVLTAYALISIHSLSMLCEDDTYDGLVSDVFAQAEQAVTA